MKVATALVFKSKVFDQPLLIGNLVHETEFVLVRHATQNPSGIIANHFRLSRSSINQLQSIRFA